MEAIGNKVIFRKLFYLHCFNLGSFPILIKLAININVPPNKSEISNSSAYKKIPTKAIKGSLKKSRVTTMDTSAYCIALAIQ